MKNKQPNWKIPTEDELITEFEPDQEDDLAPKTTKDKISSAFNPYDANKAKEMFITGIVLSIIAIIFMIFSICYTLHLKKNLNNYQIQNQPLQLTPSYGNNFEKMDNQVTQEEEVPAETQDQTNQNVQPVQQDPSLQTPQEQIPQNPQVPQETQNQPYTNNYNNNYNTNTY